MNKKFKKTQYKVSKNSVNMLIAEFYEFLETNKISKLRNKHSEINITNILDSEVEYTMMIFGELNSNKISKELFYSATLNSGYECVENVVCLQKLSTKESILKAIYTNKPISELLIEEYNKQYEKK